MDLWGVPDPAHVAEAARIDEWRRAEDAEARAAVAATRAAQAERQLEEIRMSHSWRAMAPVRRMAALLRREGDGRAL
jgi:putative heme degradation protein